MKYACRMWHGSGVAPPAASHRRFCCVLSVLLQGHICECLLARVWGCWYKTWSTFKGIVHSKMKTLTLFTRSCPTCCYLVLWDATGGFFFKEIYAALLYTTTIHNDNDCQAPKNTIKNHILTQNCLYNIQNTYNILIYAQLFLIVLYFIRYFI